MSGRGARWAAGIAQVVAASGRRVSLYDAAPGAVERALETMRKSLASWPRRAGPIPTRCSAAVSPVDDLVPADLMIEAVVEDAAVKEDSLPPRRRGAAGRGRARLEHLVDPDHVARRGRPAGPTG